MARIAFLIPRIGSRSAITGIGSGSASQVDNEFLLDSANKELYVGTGASVYNGSNSRPVTFNINKLLSATNVTTNTELPVRDNDETRKTTLGAIVNLVSAEAGDTKTVIATADEPLSQAGALLDKMEVYDGLRLLDGGTVGNKKVGIGIEAGGILNSRIRDNAVNGDKIDDLAIEVRHLHNNLIKFGSGESYATTPRPELWTGKKIMEYISSKVMVPVHAWWKYPVTNLSDAQKITSTVAYTDRAYHFVAGGNNTQWAAEEYVKPFVGMKILIGAPSDGNAYVPARLSFVAEVTEIIEATGQTLSWTVTSCSPEILYYSYGTITSTFEDINDDTVFTAGNYLEKDTTDNRLVYTHGGEFFEINIDVETITAGQGLIQIGDEMQLKPKTNGGLSVDGSGVSVTLNPTSPGLSINEFGLNFVAKNASLNVDGSGVEVQLAGSGGIELTGTGLAITQVIGGTI